MRKALKRLIDIWKLDFLTKFLSCDKDDNRTTILFWVISNILLTLLMLASFSFFVVTSQDKIVTTIKENVPDDAHVSIIDGQLITENIDEPFFREININNKGADYNKKIVIIIDTSKQIYDIASLDDYENGILVLRDRIYTKSGNKIEQLVFADVPNISFSKKDLIKFVDEYLFKFLAILNILIGIIIFIYFVILRLISAFWWALMLFVIMRIFDVKEKYSIAYKAVLNFYFIPTIVVIILGIFGFTIPLLTTIIFLTVFIANIIWYKKQMEKDAVKISLIDNIEHNIEKKEETPVITKIKK